MLLKMLDKLCALAGVLHQQGESVGPSSVEQAFGIALLRCPQQMVHHQLLAELRTCLRCLLQLSASDGSECRVSLFWGFLPHSSDEVFLEVHVQRLWNPWPHAFDRTVYFLSVIFSHYGPLKSCIQCVFKNSSSIY